MIKVDQIRDYELIRKVMTHPRIYPHITDDSSCPATQFQPIQDERIYYLAATNQNGLLGIAMAVPENGVELRVHHFILPHAWGPMANVIARKWIDWLWQNTDYRRLLGKTPEYNKLALRFAARVGFKMFGIDCKSIQKNGRLWDQYLYGMSRNGGNHGN